MCIFKGIYQLNLHAAHSLYKQPKQIKYNLDKGPVVRQITITELEEARKFNGIFKVNYLKTNIQMDGC